MLAFWIVLAQAAEPRRVGDCLPRTRWVMSAAPYRDGTLTVEACVVDPAMPAEGDWQALRFIPNGFGAGWTRPLGAQTADGEVWWRAPSVTALDLDGDDREELIVRGELSNCGAGGCITGTAELFVWADVRDQGGDCGRRGFEDASRGRLLVWQNARYDVPGWRGPSWVRAEITRGADDQLFIEERWTAMPPADHEILTRRTALTQTAFGLAPRCPAATDPGVAP